MSSSAPLLRPLAPTGALGVGDPPVAAHAVVTAPRRRDEEPLAAGLRAFPHLDAEEVKAALDQADLDPAPLSPRPGWLDALWLALPLAAGMQLVGNAIASVLGLVSVVVLQHLLGARLDDPDPTDGAALSLVVAGVLAATGVGLLRLEPWARLTGALLGAVLVGRAALSESPLLGTFAAFGLCWLALIAPPVGRWTTPDGRAARRAIVTRPLLQATLWGGVVVGVLLFVVPAFDRMFRETGVTLLALAQLTVEASYLANDWQVLLPPALLLGAVPLLRLHPRHERPASLAIGVAGLAALGTIGGSLLLTLLDLISKL